MASKYVKCNDESYHDINEMNCEVDPEGKIISTDMKDKANFNGFVKDGKVQYFKKELNKKYYGEVTDSKTNRYFYVLPDGTHKPIVGNEKKLKIFRRFSDDAHYYYDGKKYIKVFKDKTYNLEQGKNSNNETQKQTNKNDKQEKRANNVTNKSNKSGKNILGKSAKISGMLLQASLSTGPFAIVLMPILMGASAITMTAGLAGATVAKITGFMVSKISKKSKNNKTAETNVGQESSNVAEEGEQNSKEKPLDSQAEKIIEEINSLEEKQKSTTAETNVGQESSNVAEEGEQNSKEKPLDSQAEKIIEEINSL